MNIYTTNITNDSGRGGRDNAKENTVATVTAQEKYNCSVAGRF